jgi:hypothetical protein
MMPDQVNSMPRTALLAVCVVAAAVAGAAVFALAFPREPSGVSPDLEREFRRVSEELRELKTGHHQLESDVRRLSFAPPLPEGDARPAAPPDPAASAPGTAITAPPPTPEERIDEKVRTAVAESRVAEMERIGQRFSAMARQREAAILDRFTEASHLSAYQREEVEKVLDRRREAIGAFFRTLFGGGGDTDPVAIREKVADVQRETDEAIKSLLSPEQYEEWKKVDEAARQNPFGPPMGAPR